MIKYLKERDAILLMGYAVFLIVLLNNMSTLREHFSYYLEHSKRIEPSMLQVRMSQYKKILRRDENGLTEYKSHLKKFLK